MSGQADEQAYAPVALEFSGNGEVTLSFGPMSIDDLLAMIAALGTPEGNGDFTTQLLEELARFVQATTKKRGDADE